MKRRRRAGRGFTLIEVLAVIGVVALLMAILLPAVQQVRSAARKTQCTNNLKQMGIAINEYIQALGALPALNSSRGFSIHVTLLPYIDNINLYNSINTSMGYIAANASNSTFVTAGPASLLCPADGGAHAGNTSYAGNVGVGICPDGYYGACDNGGLPILVDRSVGISAIKDGTSSTVAVSEWVTGVGRDGDLLRNIYTLPIHYDDFAPFAAACNGAGPESITPMGKGAAWMWGDLGQSVYNHDMKLNYKSCINSWAPVTGAWTASSMHDGGAMVLFVDGHTAFIRQSVAVGVWRALGTRAGAEVLSDDSY